MWISDDEGFDVVVDPGPWPDLKIDVAGSFPRVAPGVYVARSVGYERFEAFARRCLRLDFELYQSEVAFASGLVLASGVPMFFRLPRGSTLSPSSKLARTFLTAGIRLRSAKRLPLEPLRHKLWEAEVADVVKSAQADLEGRPVLLPEPQRYSVVRQLLKRLA